MNCIVEFIEMGMEMQALEFEGMQQQIENIQVHIHTFFCFERFYNVCFLGCC